MRTRPYGKIVWSKKHEDFVRKNHPIMTNRQLADKLPYGLTTVRQKCYELGLYRMRLEYWTPEQERFLEQNYRLIGDYELAEIFNRLWNKNKGWTHKHIEKKRKYLGLIRTRKQLDNIYQRNLDAGRLNSAHAVRFMTTGPAKNGEIRMWKNQYQRPTPKIKINGKWVFWNRWAWEKKYGRIPKGKFITFKDGNPYHRTIRNLEAVSQEELTRRNAITASVGLSDNYIAALLAYGNAEMREEMKKHPELINLKRSELKLRRKIKHAKAS